MTVLNFDKLPNISPSAKARLTDVLTQIQEAEKRKRCMRSSAGCRQIIQPDVETAQSVPPKDLLGAVESLPDTRYRLGLLRKPRGVTLTQFEAQWNPIDERLLFSTERTQTMGALSMSRPVKIPSGFVFQLKTDGPGVDAALIRLDNDGRLVGAPVRAATMSGDAWFSGCIDSTCFVAVRDMDGIIGTVLSVTDFSSPPCESQVPVTYPSTQ